MADRDEHTFRGTRNLHRLSRISQTKQEEEIRRGLELGLEGGRLPSTTETISLFSRGHLPAFAGINTFMKAHYCEDIRRVGEYEAAFVGVPFDTGTTYRPGTRFGPQAVRRISAVYDGYSVDGGIDLPRGTRSLRCRRHLRDSPAISRRPSTRSRRRSPHVYTSGAFPILCGGDHSPGLSQCPRYRAPYRRQRRHHPFRPPYRHG